MPWSDIFQQHQHEQVTLAQEAAAGYAAVLAIHSTALGPALGGTRVWPYPTMDAALSDALLSSRGMSYKAALAGLPFGGGAAVIVAPSAGAAETAVRQPLLAAHGRAVERLAGRFIAIADADTTPADLATIAGSTAHVTATDAAEDDQARITARGVCRALEAAARIVWGQDSVAERTVAVQGLGHVGWSLAELLVARGARLLVTDIDEARVEAAVTAFGAVAIAPDDIYDVPVDLLAPCALGAVLNDDTIPRLRVQAVAGAADRPLAEPRHADALAARHIVYVPDYAANAGGLMQAASARAGWTRDEMIARVDGIFDTVLTLHAKAEEWRTTMARAADRLVEERMAGAASAR